MAENAMGTPQDMVGALTWYMIAAQNDNDGAKAAVERLRQVMSGGDIAKARSRAAAFKPQAEAAK
jgi:TPR repeat protein